VAILATVLTSTLTPPVIASAGPRLFLLPPLPGQTAANSQPVGLCEVPPTPSALQPPVLIASLGTPLPLKSTSIINLACQEISPASSALTRSLFTRDAGRGAGPVLPGWPAKWVGRK